jgi:hypothetical protein
VSSTIERNVRHQSVTGGHFPYEMNICAWCERKLGLLPGKLRRVPTTNYGMCSDCLAERLAVLTRRAA